MHAIELMLSDAPESEKELERLLIQQSNPSSSSSVSNVSAALLGSGSAPGIVT